MTTTHNLLIDTSVWIKFIDEDSDLLSNILAYPEVVTHPFVVDELAVGDTGDRTEFLLALQTLEQLKAIDDPEVLRFLKEHKLQARGIGYIDCHLLASAVADSNTKIWTLDRRFRTAANRLGVDYPPELAQQQYRI